MRSSVPPKVFIDEEYVDLRNHPESIGIGQNQIRCTTPNTNKSRNDRSRITSKDVQLKNEKELIQSGLKKLVKTYNIATEYSTKFPLMKKERTMINPRTKYDYPDNHVTSKSDLFLEMSNSQKRMVGLPIKPMKSKQSCMAINIDARGDRDNTYQENTNLNDHSKKFDLPKCLRIRSQDSLELEALIPPKTKKYSNPKIENYKLRDDHNPLLSTSSPATLQAQWKRHKTVPEIHMTRPDWTKEADKNTYLYDDGSDVDSTYIEQKQAKYFTYAFESQFLNLLFFAGTVCGIFLVSLLVWIIFGNEFFSILMKPRELQETPVKRAIKYVGGGIVHIVTSIFKTLGKLLAIPTQQIYQSQPEYYRWPAMLQR